MALIYIFWFIVYNYHVRLGILKIKKKNLHNNLQQNNGKQLKRNRCTKN